MTLYSAISKIHGLGLFTDTATGLGGSLCNLEGTFLTKNELPKDYDQFPEYFIHIDKDLYFMFSDGYTHHLNHSCHPNAFVRLIKINDNYILKLIPLRTIYTNEEITIDYSTLIQEDDSTNFKCNCHFKNCRRDIKFEPFLVGKNL